MKCICKYVSLRNSVSKICKMICLETFFVYVYKYQIGASQNVEHDRKKQNTKT